MNNPLLRILCTAWIVLFMASCEDTIIGYYQGTFTSTDNLHASGNAKMNLSKTGSNSFDLTLEAVNWKLVQATQISLVTKNVTYGFNEYVVNSTNPSLNGYIDIWGHAKINYKEGPLTVTFSVQK